MDTHCYGFLSKSFKPIQLPFTLLEVLAELRQSKDGLEPLEPTPPGAQDVENQLFRNGDGSKLMKYHIFWGS